MFRHSELQTLERAKEKGQSIYNSSAPIPIKTVEAENEDGEIMDEDPQPMTTGKKKKKNKKKKRGSGNSNKRWEPDPERRKRTWDVVETGLDALDYDEMEQSGTPTDHVAQRRRITYDDEG